MPLPRRSALAGALLLLLAAGLASGGGREPAPSVQERAVVWLGDPKAVHLEPSAATDVHGRGFAAWLVWRTDGVSPYVGTSDGEHAAALSPSAAYPAHPALAPLGDGVYCLWEEGAAGERVLRGRAVELVRGELVLGPIETIPFPGLHPTLARTAPGRVELVCQASAGASYDLFHAARTDEGWSAPTPLATTPHDEWHPRAASAGDGALHLVFDRWNGRSFDVEYRRLEDGAVVAEVPVAVSPAYEAYPDVVLAPDGAAWIVWERTFGFGLRAGLRTERRLALAVVRGEALERVDLPGNRAAGELPRITWAGAGPVVFARIRGDVAKGGGRAFASWRTRVLRFDRKGKPGHTELGVITGGNDATESLLPRPDGTIACVFATDGRRLGRISSLTFAESIEGEWRVGVTGVAGSAGAPSTRAIAVPTPAPAIPWSERAAGAPLFGDLHRHTHLSRCSSSVDGIWLDQVRYARGPGQLDFLAVTDHFQHLREWSWWRTLRDVERYDDPGRLVVLAGLERMVSGRGHQNLVFAGHAPEVAALGADVDPSRVAAAEARRLVAIPHMTSSSNNAWNWNWHDPRVHRIVEIYQGQRGSYEGAAGPHPARDRAVPAGDVSEGVRAGKHFGLIAASDHGSTGTSYAGLYADGLTRAAVFDALRGRRAFAATARVAVDTTLGPLAMGQEGTGAGDAPFVVRAAGGGPLAAVEVLKNGEPFAFVAGEGRRELVVLSLRGTEALDLVVKTAAEVLSARTRREGAGTVEQDAGTVSLSKVGRTSVDVVIELDRARAITFEARGGKDTLPLGRLPRGTTRRLLLPDSAVFVTRLGPPLEVETFERAFADPDRAAGDSYYARVTWADGNVAWTSPIRAR